MTWLRSEDEARKIAARLLEEIEFLRQEAAERGERFEALTREQLLGKIKGETSKSPFFFAQSWGAAPRGGSTTYTAYVSNPDPNGYGGSELLGHLFFGPSNFIGSSDLALTAIDPRFPHYYQSCAMAAGSTAKLTFTIDPSAGLRPGVYMGNCFLVLRGYLGVGTHLDRVAFDMTVI